MPITIKVNGTNLSLVHKMSTGISTATLPDVCKTPTPGGPVPMPYPNIAQSITLSNGTTTVKGDKMMAANKGSKFALSNGDNAGVAGGVKSSTFMKEATWILYSFTVKLQSKGAARLTDKMFHNSENTVNLAGVLQQMLVDAGCTADEANAICDALCATQAKYDRGELKGSGSCSKDFENRINQLKKDGRLGSGIKSEQPFYMPRDGRPPVPLDGLTGGALGKIVDFLGSHGIDVLVKLGPGGLPSRGFIREVCSHMKDIPSQRLVRFPDLIVENGATRKVFDAKFSYEKRLGAGMRDKFSPDQLEAYRKISKPPGQDPTALTPEGCGCPGY
jgi:hypothetical protein